MSASVKVRVGMDLDAFVASEYPKVVAAVGLITGNRQDAADAVQDAIVGFLAKPPAHPVTNLAAWFTVVASNRVRDGYRSDAAKQRAVAKLGEPVEGVDDAVELLDVDVMKPLVYLSDLRLSFAGTRSSLGVRPGRQCFDGPITPAATNEELHVGEQIPVEVYLAYRPGDQADPATRYADGALECTPADGTAQQYLRFTGSVTIGQILAGATVTMTDPASGYTATLALHHP